MGSPPAREGIAARIAGCWVLGATTDLAPPLLPELPDDPTRSCPHTSGRAAAGAARPSARRAAESALGRPSGRPHLLLQRPGQGQQVLYAFPVLQLLQFELVVFRLQPQQALPLLEQEGLGVAERLLAGAAGAGLGAASSSMRRVWGRAAPASQVGAPRPALSLPP
jgi:hypothetical protein